MASLVTDRLATITSVGQGDTSVSAPPIRPLGWSSRGELTAFLTVLVNKAGLNFGNDPSLALVGRAHVKLDIPFPRLWVG